MRRDRLILAVTLVMGVLLLSPLGLEAQPGAIQQPRKGQRVVANAVLKLVKKKKHCAGISGTVVSIHRNKEAKGTGTITLAVHHHAHKKNVQNAVNNVNANAAANVVKVVKKPCKRAAVAVGQQKKKKTHTVTISFAKGTKFAVTVKGLFQGKAQVKTVGKGSAKTQVVVPGKVKLETRNLPTSHTLVKKGQHLKITLHDLQHHNAKEVHIISPSAEANNNVKK